MRKTIHAWIEWGCGRIGNPVCKGPGRRRSVALTFDDGPSPGTTRLLDLLAQNSIKATFFQCGLNVLRYPEIARAVRDAGHEIGNHSYSHARLAPRPSWSPNVRTPGFVLKEFRTAQDVFREQLGVLPAVMRVPYGLYWFGVDQAARLLQMRDVLWTVIGHDWEWPAERVAGHICASVAPGSIICLHDGRDVQACPDIDETVRAVRRVISALSDAGYQFETVSDLLYEGVAGAGVP